MVFSGQKTCLGTMKNLYKTMIKTVTKDTYPKEMKKQQWSAILTRKNENWQV